jgi:hypothetical protein
MKELLRAYVPLRIAPDDPSQVQANVQRSMALHAEMWAIAAVVARSGHSPDLMSAFGDLLSEIVSLNETRVVSAVYARARDGAPHPARRLGAVARHGRLQRGPPATTSRTSARP